MGIVENAKMASEAWQEFTGEEKSRENISNYFHLRPTKSKGITVVSTLPRFEMRGILRIKRKKDLINKLKEIHEHYKVLVSVNNEERKSKIMKNLGFPCRDGKGKQLEEEKQATMINTMSDDRNLANCLNAYGNIRFIASELIMEQGYRKNKGRRVDIVGCDGSKLYLFELKKGRTRNTGQVRDYVSYYSSPKKRKVLEELLQNYPINRVDGFRNILGVMVMRYAENSPRDYWAQNEKENNIKILFYKPSLTYCTPTGK